MENEISIYDIDNVLRRVPSNWPNYIKPDGSITSLAFRLRKNEDGTFEDGISVDLERLSSFEQATLGSTKFRLLRVNIGNIRNEINDGLDVVHSPLENNFAHSLITGEVTKSKQRLLVKYSTEVTN